MILPLHSPVVVYLYPRKPIPAGRFNQFDFTEVRYLMVGNAGVRGMMVEDSRKQIAYIHEKKLLREPLEDIGTEHKTA